MSERGRSLIDRFLDFEARHTRGTTVFLTIWMMTSWVFYTDWIDWPEIPFVNSLQVFWTSVAFNALWWGFARPKLMERKAARLAERERA
ncbi:hypothetical protein [Erythrobacter alti]|uniref:hypothetical protein n=1 Tax=Erythrobacter alti TaxID=1896145 RepID=UPI0030F4AC05